MADPSQHSSNRLGFDQIDKSIKKPKLIFRSKPKTPDDFITGQQQQNQKPHLQIQREDKKQVVFKGFHGNIKNQESTSLTEENNGGHTQNTFQESSNGGGMKVLSEKVNCRVCGKCFPSLKSLSGHVRMHPRKSWKEIKPLSMGHSMIDHQTQNSSDLSHSLTSWGSTDTRGRITLTDNEKIAIDALLMLGNLVVLHSSKENRENPKICMENEISSSLFDQEKIKNLNAVKELTQVIDQLHELKICDSMISTVEAPGGHQWQHDTGTTRAPIDSVEETVIVNKKKVDFDLNELPPSSP